MMNATDSKKWDYDANDKVFANTLAKGFADHIIEHSKANYRNISYVAPDASDPESWTLNLDITQKANAVAIQCLIKHIIFIPPFDNWLTKFSKDFDLERNSLNDCKKVMERVGILAEAKLKEILNDFTSHPMRQNLKYEITLSNLELQIKFWIDQEATMQAKL